MLDTVFTINREDTADMLAELHAHPELGFDAILVVTGAERLFQDEPAAVGSNYTRQSLAAGYRERWNLDERAANARACETFRSLVLARGAVSARRCASV